MNIFIHLKYFASSKLLICLLLLTGCMGLSFCFVRNVAMGQQFGDSVDRSGQDSVVHSPESTGEAAPSDITPPEIKNCSPIAPPTSSINPNEAVTSNGPQPITQDEIDTLRGLINSPIAAPPLSGFDETVIVVPDNDNLQSYEERPRYIAGMNVGSPIFIRAMNYYSCSKREFLLLVLYAGTEEEGIVAHRNVEQAKRLLAKNPELAKATYPDTTSVLLVAVRLQSPSLVKALLLNGANPSIEENGAPLIITILSQGYPMTKAFFDGGVDPNDATLDDHGMVIIENALPIHYAAMMGQYEIVKLLLSRGADPNVRDSDGAMPFDYAVIGLNSHLNLMADWHRVCELFVPTYKKYNASRQGYLLRLALESFLTKQKRKEEIRRELQARDQQSLEDIYKDYSSSVILRQTEDVLRLLVKNANGKVEFMPFYLDSLSSIAGKEKRDEAIEKFSVKYSLVEP